MAVCDRHAAFECNSIAQLKEEDYAASLKCNTFGHRYRATQLRLEKGNSRLAITLSTAILEGLNDVLNRILETESGGVGSSFFSSFQAPS